MFYNQENRVFFLQIEISVIWLACECWESTQGSRTRLGSYWDVSAATAPLPRSVYTHWRSREPPDRPRGHEERYQLGGTKSATRSGNPPPNCHNRIRFPGMPLHFHNRRPRGEPGVSHDPQGPHTLRDRTRSPQRCTPALLDRHTIGQCNCESVCRYIDMFPTRPTGFPL